MVRPRRVSQPLLNRVCRLDIACLQQSIRSIQSFIAKGKQQRQNERRVKERRGETQDPQNQATRRSAGEHGSLSKHGCVTGTQTGRVVTTNPDGRRSPHANYNGGGRSSTNTRNSNSSDGGGGRGGVPHRSMYVSPPGHEHPRCHQTSNAILHHVHQQARALT